MMIVDSDKGFCHNVIRTPHLFLTVKLDFLHVQFSVPHCTVR